MKFLDKNILAENIEQIAMYDLENNNVFGCSYSVCQNGESIYKKHFGVSDWNKKLPVDDNTIFRLASMTKPITAVAILTLIEEGIITLNTAVKSILPQFDNIHIISENRIDLGVSHTDVTIMHFLTHTSGFGSLKPANMTDEEKRTINNTINYFIKQGLDFEPFSREAYSAFAAFDVLAAIVESVTGMDYEEFLKKEIFTPCNMKNTTFMPTETQCKHIIDMHNKADGENCVENMPSGCVFETFPSTHKLAGAGLVSTLEDYAKFAQMLLKKVKENKTFEMLAKAYKPMASNQNWGLGVRVITKDTYPYLPIGTFGWSGAYGSHFWCDPENNITAVYMKNSMIDGGAGNKSACRFEEAVYSTLS